MRILLFITAISFLFYFSTEVNAGINIDLNLPFGFKSISPVQFSTVKNDRIVLKGELKDDFKLKSVRIKGDYANIIDNGFETEDIQLREGMNSLLIELTDVNGRRRLVSYSLIYDPKTAAPGGGSLVDRPILTVDMIAEGYTAPRPRKKLSTRIIRRTENPPSPVNKNNADVVFSSPYTNQVITENKLKIGGRFNTNAGIKAITVNGQPCELEQSSGTFKGPMLLSPMEARTKKVNSDSKDFILMKVDPVSHSGKNELIVKISPGEGKPYEDRIIFYYYQLYVTLETFGKCYTSAPVEKNGEGGIGPIMTETEFELPYSYSQGYNQNIFSEIPFSGWEYDEYNGRTFDFDYDWYFYTTELQGKHRYYEMPAFYFAMDNYWNPLFQPSPVASIGPIRTINDTKIIVHTPPLRELPFIIILRNCDFLETTDMFAGVPELDLKDYKINGIPLSKLSGDFERRVDGGLEDIAYIIINDYTPDIDMELKLETPTYKTCFDFYVLNPQGHRITHNNVCNKYFFASVEDGLRGDILVDSDNNGFLGGEDNAYEMVFPGCVFWVNDDDDYNESSVHPDDNNPALASGEADCHDNKINGIRDLEDFMPFNMTIPNVKEWTNNQNVKFYLKAEGEGKIRVFKRIKDMREYGAKTYLNDLDSSRSQYQEEMKFLLPSDGNKKEGQLLDPSWFDSEGRFCAIFEGVKEGSLKLILEVQLGEGDNKKRVVLDEVYLTLKNVRDMYRFINVREGPTVGNTDDKLRYRNINVERSDMFMLDTSSVYMFIHGAWTPKSDAVTWSNTVYKRLYRTGYRGGFIGFSWETTRAIDWPIVPIGSGNPKTEFDDEWVRSFQTGQVLADVIENTKNEFKNAKINLMAHSLGGNLTSYALRLLNVQDRRDLVDNVFLIQVAVPGNAYACRTEKDYFKDMYVFSVANNITGKAYNLFYGKDGTLSWFNKALSGGFPSILLVTGLNELGVPFPLDDNYDLLPSDKMYGYSNVGFYRHEKSISGALGRQNLNSKLSNFVSYQRKFKTARPYGIRDHLSFGNEYYFDVKEYYTDILNPGKIKIER